MTRKPLFWSAVATFVLWLGMFAFFHDKNILDARFSYPPQEALAFFYDQPADRIQALRLFSLVDLFLFIPAYGSLLFLLSSHCGRARLPIRLVATVALAADIMESSLIWVGLGGHGWNSIPTFVATATPVKWVGIIFASFLIAVSLFRGRFRRG